MACLRGPCSYAWLLKLKSLCSTHREIIWLCSPVNGCKKEEINAFLPWCFLGDSEDKESAHSAEDLGVIPRSGRSLGEGNSYAHQYSCLENSMDRGSWMGTVSGVHSPGGHKELDMTAWLTLLSFPWCWPFLEMFSKVDAPLTFSFPLPLCLLTLVPHSFSLWFYNRPIQTPARWLFWDISLPSSQLASSPNKVVFFAWTPHLLDLLACIALSRAHWIIEYACGVRA